MNNTYLSNYWILYREFIETFSELKFKGIPIALMTNFYQHIDENLKTKMEDDSFKKGFIYQITSLEEIQPFFEKYLAPLKKPTKPNVKGRVLINADYIRIPEKIIIENFHRNNTIILSRSKVLNHLGLPNECIGNYKVNAKEASDSLISKAKMIFSKYKDHPAFGNSFFREVFINRIPVIVETISTVFNLYEKIQISSIVVGTTEDILSRTLAVVASIVGIPSICLQHGILMGEEAFLPAFASVMAVYGYYEKKWYKTRGLTDDRIATIGHPRYDVIFTDSHLSKQSFIKTFKLDSNKLTLLIATGPNIDFNKFRRLIDIIAADPRFQIIIKPHPWEIGKGKYNSYLQLKAQYKSIEVITNRSINTYDLLSNVDGVLTSLSTMALEGLLFNKPVFIYDFLVSNRSYDYFELLGEFIQSDPDLLFNKVSNYYSDPQEIKYFNEVKNQFLDNSYKVKNSGKSLSDLIYKLVNSNQNES